MKSIFILTVLLFCNSLVFAKKIENYQVINQAIEYKGGAYTILRSFFKDKTNYYLVVNENTLKTQIIKSKYLKNITKKNATNTRYHKLLNTFSKPPYSLQNYGVKSINTHNVYLTVDMCPSSKKGYEEKFFNDFIKFYKKDTPIDVTFFMSALWIKKHKKEFKKIQSLQKAKKLNITWGNHTFSHPYNRKLKLKRNFLLIPNTDVEKEILDTEKTLLSNGVTPSILFRFPGLVSDEKAVKIVKKLGLISVGSNSWLAKNEKIEKGNIILIHGNKNEAYGIVKAKSLLLKKRDFTFGSILNDL